MKTEESFNAKSGAAALPPALRTHRPAIVVEPARPAAPTGEEDLAKVHDVAEQERIRDQAATTRVLTGNAEAHEDTMAGGRRASMPVRMVAAQMSDSPAARKKREEQAALARAMRELNEWIAELDELIRILESKRDAARADAQAYFDMAHDAEDLRDSLDDGISADERKRLEALFGKDRLEGKSDQEIKEMMDLYIQEQYGNAYGKENEANEYQNEINEVNEIREEAERERDRFEARAQRAHTPEEEDALAEEVETYTRQSGERLDAIEASRIGITSEAVDAGIKQGARETSRESIAEAEAKDLNGEFTLPPPVPT
ncbi:hypothetical protein RM530_17745 [Algiphilus sp. W345]|uniref:Uncharacterized protein n=1 Tax=Banduia mediterranea TaxID=3075609 RepID=A0ABU2WMU0_9GAMM|nr:hypothetical protein [Algiphilus sp. W345]MDT0499190.1 hypothetical protein [Algiphilus sp. W345]